jgi:RNA polymerase sigma-70 factor (sigma-E family)
MRERRGFEVYLETAWARLLRTAWLLTGDWQRADDLVQTVLGRAYGRWPKLRQGDADAYLRAMMATTWLGWRRRRWRGEAPVKQTPQPDGPEPRDDIDPRRSEVKALARMPGPQWAVVVLRFHGDLTVVAAAYALGLSVGTVKSYTARAMATLRADARLRSVLTEDVSGLTRDYISGLLDSAIPAMPPRLQAPPHATIRRRARRRTAAMLGVAAAVAGILLAVGSNSH